MARLREDRERQSALVAFCLALSLGLSQGCARSEPLHRTDASPPASEQKLPFHTDTDRMSAGLGAVHAAVPDPKQAASLPFRAVSHPRILPAGTLLTVQLQGSLSTAEVRAGDLFTASVTGPFTLDGETLIAPGTAVTGRVESAQSRLKSGYLRLTLSAITVEGRLLALHTSSLFARGTLQQANNSSRISPSELRSDRVRVQNGRRLTFRLTAPVMLDRPKSIENPQYSGRTTE